jgi:hypothetical protein
MKLRIASASVATGAVLTGRSSFESRFSADTCANGDTGDGLPINGRCRGLIGRPRRPIIRHLHLVDGQVRRVPETNETVGSSAVKKPRRALESVIPLVHARMPRLRKWQRRSITPPRTSPVACRANSRSHSRPKYLPLVVDYSTWTPTACASIVAQRETCLAGRQRRIVPLRRMRTQRPHRRAVASLTWRLEEQNDHAGKQLCGLAYRLGFLALV